MISKLRMKALAEYLDCSITEIETIDGYDYPEFDVDGKTYMVLDSVEASGEMYNQVKEYFDDPSFREMYVDLSNYIDQSMFEGACKEYYEDFVSELDSREYDAFCYDHDIDPDCDLVDALVEQVRYDYKGDFCQWYLDETDKTLDDCYEEGLFWIADDYYSEVAENIADLYGYDLISPDYTYLDNYDCYIFEI